MKILLITNPLDKSRNYICRQIQIAWDAEVKNDNRKNDKDFLHESEYFKIIDCKDKYDSFDKNFTPEVVYIVPELMWANDDINEGYDIARELITNKYKSEYIQVAFLSVLDRSILAKIVDTRNKSFVEAFPHVCLLDDNLKIKFEYFSQIHFKLIKHLAISNEGRLQRISHKMNSVKANILRKTKDVDLNKTDLLENLEELTLFQQWTERNLTDEITKIREATDNNNLASVSKSIENIIDEINVKLPKEGEANEINVRNKSNYKVFVIEDDKEYRDFIHEIFSKFYLEVYPDKNDKYLIEKNTKDFRIREADEIIKSIGRNYNIFLLDLLYKDDNGDWLNFNGLDLYQLVRKVNPYAVIRIITSLPRGIVAKVVEVIMSNTEKPNTDQVFTKKYGFYALKDNIIESIEKINFECAEKENIRTQLFPVPRTGIFDKPGMRDLMISLLANRLLEYEERKEIALNLFSLYSNNQLTKDTEKWNKGILGKGASFSKPTEKFFLEKLVNIMVYRLISLDVALVNDYFRIYFKDFHDRISSFSSISGINNEFFYSLGFQLGNETKNESFFSLKFSNLLPHESLILDQKRSEKYKNLKVNSYQNLYEWTLNTILNYNYLGSIWKELNIKEFDWFKKNFDKNTVTVSQLKTFFAHLYANSMKPLLFKVLEHIRENETLISSEIDAELSKLPELKLQIDLVLNIEK